MAKIRTYRYYGDGGDAVSQVGELDDLPDDIRARESDQDPQLPERRWRRKPRRRGLRPRPETVSSPVPTKAFFCYH